MIWYVKFNRLPFTTDKIYDDEFIANRFPFQLTTFERCVLIGISRLSCSYCTCYSYWSSIPLSSDYVLNSNIDRVISTTSWSYCIWNSCCQNHRRIPPNFSLFLHDLVRLNSIACRVQTIRYAMTKFSPIDSAINSLRLKFLFWYLYLNSFVLILCMK